MSRLSEVSVYCGVSVECVFGQREEELPTDTGRRNQFVENEKSDTLERHGRKAE